MSAKERAREQVRLGEQIYLALGERHSRNDCVDAAHYVLPLREGRRPLLLDSRLPEELLGYIERLRRHR
jgi:hypothetical protein